MTREEGRRHIDQAHAWLKVFGSVAGVLALAGLVFGGGQMFRQIEINDEHIAAITLQSQRTHDAIAQLTSEAAAAKGANDANFKRLFAQQERILDEMDRYWTAGRSGP